jgi:hypothetical protein
LSKQQPREEEGRGGSARIDVHLGPTTGSHHSAPATACVMVAASAGGTDA